MKSKTKSYNCSIYWIIINFVIRFLAQGTFLLSLWPRQVEKQVGPAPDPGSHPDANSCPVISIELPELGSPVVFPMQVPIQAPPSQDFNFKGKVLSSFS